MKLSELRQKSPTDLDDLLGAKLIELADLRLDLDTQKSKQTHQLGELKKTIAQINTVRRELALAKTEAG